MQQLLDKSQLEKLRQKVYKLLDRVGMKIDSEEIVSALAKKGCHAGADGRIRMPREALCELVELQKSRVVAAQASAARLAKPSEPTESTPVVIPCAFSPGPTAYYDFDQRAEGPVTTKVFSDIIKFADATPEIGRVHPWYRQDSPPEIEGIESLVLGLKLSKKISPLDAIFPKQVRYLAEISEIVTGRTGDSSYQGGSQCITPPLHLGQRSAEEIIERARCGVRRYFVGTMPAVGFSTPVALADAIVLASAEVMGGMLAAFAVNPEAEFTGICAATVADMATGNMAMNAPETVLVDIGVKNLFDAHFGGHVTAYVAYSPNAQVPGLQAVYENFFATVACACLVEPKPFYCGSGNLAMGRLGSPVQAMLDIEIAKSISCLNRRIDVDAGIMPFDALCECVLQGKSFIDSDHTLSNFRRIWQPKLFLRQMPDADWAGSEADILERCNGMVKANLSRYTPPEWPPEVLRGIDRVLDRARRELT